MCYISCYLSSFLPTSSSRANRAPLSLGEHVHLLDVFLLLLGEGAEELDLVLAGRAPLVVDLERALQVLLHLHVERRRLHAHKRRVVNARDRLRRHQVVQVARQLGELRPCCLLLALLFLELHVPLVVLEALADLLILKQRLKHLNVLTLCCTWLR